MLRSAQHDNLVDEAARGDSAEKRRGRRIPAILLGIVVGTESKPPPGGGVSAIVFLVSAAGFEPATHALKGRCSTN